MDFAADILMISGALGVAFYCFVLSRRLSRFTDLEKGVGGAVAVLSAQVDDLTKALQSARAASEESDVSLRELTDRAESVARRLELQVAAMHDLPNDLSSETQSADPTVEASPVVSFTHSTSAATSPSAPPAATAPSTPPAATPAVQSFFASHRAAEPGPAQ